MYKITYKILDVAYFSSFVGSNTLKTKLSEKEYKTCKVLNACLFLVILKFKKQNGVLKK